MSDFTHSPRDKSAQRNDALSALTRVPGHIWAECVDSVRESREAIGQAVRDAMDEKEISSYLLAEKAGLSVELIELIRDGSYDLHDSLPISKLEEALGVRLNHL